MALLDGVRQLGISRGLLGNSRLWLVLGALAWAIRAVNWARRSQERTLFREALEPGQTLVISTSGPPPSKRAHRRSMKAERRLQRREMREQLSTARMRRRHRVL